MTDREPVVVFIQQSDKPDQWVPKKLHRDETQRDVTKKRKHFDMSLCESASTITKKVNYNKNLSAFASILIKRSKSQIQFLAQR